MAPSEYKRTDEHTDKVLGRDRLTPQTESYHAKVLRRDEADSRGRQGSEHPAQLAHEAAQVEDAVALLRLQPHVRPQVGVDNARHLGKHRSHLVL